MPTRLAIGAITALAAVFTIWAYGKYQYRQGIADEKLRTQVIQAEIERGLQYEKDKADAKYRAAIAARQVAKNDLDSVQRELERVLKNLRNAETTNASSRLNAASAGRLEGFAACVREYGSLAKDAARWADQVNGLRRYVETVQ